MGVCKKGRRKITVDNQNYVWYVSEDDGSPYYILNIISEDKKFILSCPLEMNDTAYFISKGKIFQQYKTSGRWERYISPFGKIHTVTPRTVSEIILWVTHKHNAITYKGEIGWL